MDQWNEKNLNENQPTPEETTEVTETPNEPMTEEPAAAEQPKSDENAPRDAEYIPVSEEAPRQEAEPRAICYETLYESEPPKEKKRPTWKRLTVSVIIAAVAAFLAGVLFSVQVIFPLLKGLSIEDISLDDYFEDYREEQDETPDKNEGTQKEREEYADHPAQLPEIGGTTPQITDSSNPVPEIVEQLSDGVVLITTQVTTQYQNGTEQKDDIAGGTGFVISQDGYIVTNNHVISEGSDFHITMPSGAEYDAMLVGTDTETDLAVLKIEPKEKLTVLPLGDSEEVRTGEMAIAIGNASGAGETLTGTVTVGYISAVNRELTFNGATQPFLQTDAALNSGNSGGPLLNAKGEVIGISTLKSLVSSYTTDGYEVNSEGIGFAIPINRALEKIQTIILSGSIRKPGIGLSYYTITPEYAAKNDIPEGLMVANFTGQKSPAQEAGMMTEDIIVKADGKDIREIENISEYIGQKGIGATIKLTVYRNGEYLDFDVEICDINAMR